MNNKENEIKKTDKYIVQKSNPLLSLSKSEITLSAFKIMDAYLSRIDSHKPETRLVTFQKGELESLLGEKRIRREDLDVRLKSLFAPVMIEDPSKPEGHVIISLFERASAHKDEYDMWTVELACSLPAMEYVFNIDDKGYLPYLLKNVIDLNSRYSYILYLYLEKNRYRGAWSISIDELKEMLNCVTDRYKTFKYFNSEVLKKCFDEITSKTSLRYTYEPTEKVGRKYTKIKFCITSAQDEFFGDANFSFLADNIEITDGESSANYENELGEALGKACNNEFNPSQIVVIQDLISKIVKEDDIAKRTEYFIYKLHIMDCYDDGKKKIKNRFSYIKDMIENDIAEYEKKEGETRDTSYSLEEWHRQAEFWERQIFENNKN